MKPSCCFLLLFKKIPKPKYNKPLLLQCKLQICVNREFLVGSRKGQFWICIYFSALYLCVLPSFTLTLGTDRLVKKYEKLSNLVLNVKSLRELTDPVQLTEGLQASRHPCLFLPHHADMRGDARTLERRRSLCQSQEHRVPPSPAPGNTETRDPFS